MWLSIAEDNGLFLGAINLAQESRNSSQYKLIGDTNCLYQTWTLCKRKNKKNGKDILFINSQCFLEIFSEESILVCCLFSLAV